MSREKTENIGTLDIMYGRRQNEEKTGPGPPGTVLTSFLYMNCRKESDLWVLMS